ncbi:type II toxin-antitoxin system RelE/ParE family toxin [Pelotomaculum terephthalicicum JT]|uniref:type II toxin-antitoxin system RelE/ParE family toxin n=1 Tax=Pelotomaculum TaxID=191373 RepID=UPI0009D3DD34|nr:MULTISPECIES: type II toxin-antitoxin system RelE/ParE family toxin [Pelotomaculum]MCG9968265.1 type II toxin-antitoxin system RelE/ParE family toxin [Pelotomaculum terephthalicicum JT]OPX87289.1 MAG: Plasmid stabilization system protein [Pelotomaculum sp. PtaB.Bin117]OPY61343.1 MAG: Plasmid stabilization system protein [Pelotomaculum sp. PtaU1.Bin065]
MRKPKYKLELLTPAQRELEEIALVHMELVGVESARKITDRIYNALAHLRSHPNMGIACIDKMLRSEGYRMLICGHYLCIYRLLGETIFFTISWMAERIILGYLRTCRCKVKATTDLVGQKAG